jgi:hypothetical protein
MRHPCGCSAAGERDLATKCDDATGHGADGQHSDQSARCGGERSGHSGGNPRARQRVGRWACWTLWLEGADLDTRRVHGRGLQRRDRRHQSCRAARPDRGMWRFHGAAGDGRGTTHCARRLSEHDRSAGPDSRLCRLARQGRLYHRRLRKLSQAVIYRSWQQQRSRTAALFGSVTARHGKRSCGRIRAGLGDGCGIPYYTSLARVGSLCTSSTMAVRRRFSMPSFFMADRPRARSARSTR